MYRDSLTRASLEQAKCDHRAHRASAASEDSDEQARAVAGIQELVRGASFGEQQLRAERHVRAGNYLRDAEAQPGAFHSKQNQLLVAATMVGAELRPSRNFEQMWLEAHTSCFLIADNAQVAGWRQGGRLGLVTFLSAAACLNGAKFDGFAVSLTGWGLRRVAGPVRRAEALSDAGSFKSGFLCQLGAWELARRAGRALSPRCP